MERETVNFKDVIFLISCCIILTQCSAKERTEIINRWPNGAKKNVVTYQGEGENERITKERLYTNDDLLYCLVDHTKSPNDTLDIYDLNKQKIKQIIGNWKTINTDTTNKSPALTDTTYLKINSEMHAAFLFVNYSDWSELNNLTPSTLSVDTTEIWIGTFLNFDRGQLKYFKRRNIIPDLDNPHKSGFQPVIRKYELGLSKDGNLLQITTFPTGSKDSTEVHLKGKIRQVYDMDYQINNDTLILNSLYNKRLFIRE